VNVRVYMPVILMVLFALTLQAGVHLDVLLIPFLVLEGVAMFGSIKYRWDQIRQVDRRVNGDRRRRHDDA
jgi:hypothetical protein